MSRKIPPGSLVKVSADQRGASSGRRRCCPSSGTTCSSATRLGMIQLDFGSCGFEGYEDSLSLANRSAMESLTKQMAAGRTPAGPARRRDALLAKRERTTARMLGLWSTVDV